LASGGSRGSRGKMGKDGVERLWHGFSPLPCYRRERGSA
jgi:hypothetical protein